MVDRHKARVLFGPLVPPCSRAHLSVLAGMNLCVSILRQRNQVFRSVVVLNAVNVMHMLTELKLAVVKFPHNTVFGNIPFRVRAWVVGQMKKDISTTLYSPSFPQMVMMAVMAGAVPVEVWQGVATKMSPPPIRLTTDAGQQSATALANAAWNLLRLRNVGARASTLRVSLARVMSREKSRFPVLVSWRRLNGLATATFA